MHVGTLERLASRLHAAGIPFEVHDDSLLVRPTIARGFSVQITHSADALTVSYDGWSERFTSEDHAIACFMHGLSDRCRLKIFRRNGQPYRWTVEHVLDGQWCECSTMGTCSFPLWQQRDIEYRQNAHISGAHAA